MMIKAGDRFGRLTVIEKAIGYDRAHYLCLCSCGAEKIIMGRYLSDTPGSGKTSSCGCLRKEVTGAQRRTHASSGTRTYRIWKNMLTRCNNKNSPSYRDYGDRGIFTHPDWYDFSNFLRDMGECPTGMSIERKSNDLGYMKENCVWASALEQNRNKRNTLYIPTAQGMLKTHEFMEKHGWARGKLEHEMKMGRISPIRMGVS